MVDGAGAAAAGCDGRAVAAAQRTTKICVARHGETDWNNEGILQGWIDVPINDNGRAQALELAGILAGAGLTRVLYCAGPRRPGSSPQRGGWGAGGLHDRLSATSARWRPAEERTTHPQLARHRPAQPRGPVRPRQTLDHFASRVLGALADIGRDNPGARVLADTHGWVMDVITRHALHLPQTAILDIKRKNIECVWLTVTRGVIAESDARW
jgi:probable phosphoglycerate mutase